MKKHKIKGENVGYLFLLPSFLGVCFFILIPFLDVVRRSLLSAVTEEWVGIQNYFTVFQTPAFAVACQNTLRFSAVCIPALLALSLLIAVLLNRRAGFGKLLKTGFLFPMAIPVASVALVWRVLFDNRGVLNGVLQAFGFSGTDWMNEPTAFWVLVLSYIWKNLGYDIVLWMAGLSAISESIYEAARIDGAGEWKIFKKITVPSLMPTLFTITVLSFLNSFKVFREAYLVAGDYPHESMYLLQHVFNNWFRDLSFDKLAAGAVLTAAVIFGLTLLLQRAWEQND